MLTLLEDALDRVGELHRFITKNNKLDLDTEELESALETRNPVPLDRLQKAIRDIGIACVNVLERSDVLNLSSSEIRHYIQVEERSEQELKRLRTATAVPVEFYRNQQTDWPAFINKIADNLDELLLYDKRDFFLLELEQAVKAGCEALDRVVSSTYVRSSNGLGPSFTSEEESQACRKALKRLSDSTYKVRSLLAREPMPQFSRRHVLYRRALILSARSGCWSHTA